MSYFKRFSLSLQIFLITSFSIIAIHGAAGDVDTSFVASAIRTNDSNNQADLSIKTSVVQPDGKILIGGSFTVVGGYSRKGIARLNSDGSVDPTFNPPELDNLIYVPYNLTLQATIYGIGVQPDGKILVSGDFSRVNGVFLERLIRLNADGSLDMAFSTSMLQHLSQFEGTIYDIKVLPNNQILLGGDFGFLTENTARIFGGLVRLNVDGSFDSSFAQTLNAGAGMALRKFQLLPNGKIMVAGSGSIIFNNVGLARLNNDGTIDFSFTGVRVGVVNDFEVLANGQIMIVGNFSTVNGFSVGRIALVNSDGSLDLNFNTNNSGADLNVESIKMTVGGKPLISGAFNTYNSISNKKILRLNLDGTPDLTFTYPGNDGTVNELQLLPNNKILVCGEAGTWNRIQILNADGTLSGTNNNLVGRSGLVSSIAQQLDGKIIAGGRFVTANGVNRNNLVRYNTDGSVDTSFTSSIANPYLTVNKVIVQTDGKILVLAGGGQLFRLNPNGSNDTSFGYIYYGGTVFDFLLIPNGQILIFGSFNTSGSSVLSNVARLNTNGTINSLFSTNVPTGFITRALLQTDGKILIAGNFTQVNGVNRGRIARINSDGTLDTTFNPPGGANGAVNDLALQPNGKILLVGEFDALNGSNTKKYVGRLNSDGSLDTGFSQSADWYLNTVELQPDGRILVGGYIFAVGGVSRRGLARLNADGTLDSSFQVGSGTNNPVWDIALQSDGKILVGGEFSTYNNVSKISIMRLQNSVAPIRTQFDYDGDGKADVSVFRASENRWYILQSSNFAVVQKTFAVSGDVPSPADFDGDGKTDVAIFRPSAGDFWSLSSINNAQINFHWGANGDVPRPSDFDGDGKSDYVVFRPSNNVWYRFGSTGATSTTPFGIVGDKPLIGDFDGDGKSDVAIFRPSTGDWWYQSSINGAQLATHWGISTDIPVPADYDGDGKTDLAVYRPATGVWYIYNSSNNSFTILAFGLTGDKPVAADYDGDGKADIAVFRPNTGLWYLMQSTAGFTAFQFGVSTDVPTENAFLP